MSQDVRSPVAATDDTPGWSEAQAQPPHFKRLGADCYCGLGPACPSYREMTSEQREACSTNMRAIAQAYYMNGLGW